MWPTAMMSDQLCCLSSYDRPTQQIHVLPRGAQARLSLAINFITSQAQDQTWNKISDEIKVNISMSLIFNKSVKSIFMFLLFYLRQNKGKRRAKGMVLVDIKMYCL